MISVAYLCYSRNLPVFVKQLGFRRVHLNQETYREIALMKMARHSKLVEFIGLCIEPQGTFLVEGMCLSVNSAKRV